jgi:hypothetical protein
MASGVLVAMRRDFESHTCARRPRRAKRWALIDNMLEIGKDMHYEQ